MSLHRNHESSASSARPGNRSSDPGSGSPDQRPPRPAPASRPRLTATADGTHREAFEPRDWGLFAGVALVWGSSFLFIDVGLDAFAPAVVAFARLALAAATVALFPRARTPVDRRDLPHIALLGFVWMGAPLLLFPLAQQHVDSSVAGMINGAAPLFTALIAALLLRRLPGRWQLAGLVVGFLGVVAISLPNLQGADASPYGVGLLLLAVTFYGIAFNIAVPLQQRYGSLPVLLRAQLFAILVVIPFAAAGVPHSTWSWTSALAMVALGVLGTGLAFPAMTNLIGRVGGPRGSVAIYLVPGVAITLGVLVRGEQVAPLAIVGTVLALVGAWLTSRKEAPTPARGNAGRTRPTRPHPDKDIAGR